MSEVEKMNEAMYERLGEIAKFASNKRVELDPDFKGGRPDDAQNRLMLACFKELRQMCEFYKPEAKEPIVPGCPSLMPRQLPGGFDGEEAGEKESNGQDARSRSEGKGRLFNRKHNSSCHGVYIYDRVCMNGAHLKATLHPDNGGLEQHAMIWIGDSPRCFCYCTFNTSSPVKCDYVVRGMLAGLAKRLVYHHKNHIKRKAKMAAAKAAAENGGQA